MVLVVSTMTHTNYAASRASVFTLNDHGDQVLFYGGYYAAGAMASATMGFVWIALGFLRLFYRCYSERLEELYLLWPAPQLASLADEHGLTWDMYLDFLEGFAERVDAEILALPEDEVGTQAWAESIRSDR